MDTTITMHSVKAQFVTDESGPFVYLTDTDSCADDGTTVGMHPMQLRYIAERFAGLEPQPKPQHVGDRSAALAHRLRVLFERIDELHIALLNSRASEYTDMSRELASAGALYEIARAFTADLPEDQAQESADRAQAAEAPTTKAKTSAGPEKAASAPAAAPAGQLGLDV